MDSYSFCQALGTEEANRQLRQHWKTWVTEDIIANLKSLGVQDVRIPVGDWMFEPYEPYIGCWDGSLDELDRVIELCGKYNMTVLIDIHAMKDSQNGLDNSGSTLDLVWFSNSSFEHWNLRSGDWVGHFNRTSQTYDSVSRENLLHSLRVVESIVEKYKLNPTVIGIEPVNEPWEKTPIEVLKKFYWYSYHIVRDRAPTWITLFHDSFRLNQETWGDFLKDCPNYAYDSHIYQAWAWENDSPWFIEHACSDGDNVKKMESIGLPVVVGEWSLATDNCAMWLNGFNDNVNGYPKVKCDMIPCPPPYMGSNQPGAPPNPELGKQGPFGTGDSTPEYGMCPIDKSFPNNDDALRKLGFAKIGVFDLPTHGQFFWNFRTELEERWDFQKAVRNGWIPSKDDWENHQDNIIETYKSICNISTSTINPLIPTPTPPSSSSSINGWSSGLITVTVISILLLLLLFCAIGSAFCRVAERSDSCWFNLIHTIQAKMMGYSPIETNSNHHDFPPVLEMRQTTSHH